MAITKIPLDYNKLPKDLHVNTGATALGHSSDRYYHASSTYSTGGSTLPMSGYVMESNFFDELMNYLGTTEEWTEAGFILPDGTLLDLSGKEQGGDEDKRNLQHKDVREFGYSLVDLLDNGAIRLGYGGQPIPFVQVSLKNGMPTSAQWDRIDEILSMAPYKLDFEATMEGSDKDNPKTNFYKQYDLESEIKDIKRDLQAYVKGDKSNIGIPSVTEGTMPLCYPKGPYGVMSNGSNTLATGIAPMVYLNQGGFIDLDEQKLHGELSNLIWDENKKIKPDVKNKLLEIANLFREDLGLYTNKDIRVTGSFANYNYSDEKDDEGNYKSDIDLHLVYDFDELGVDKDILSNLFFAKKDLFNKQYNFLIHHIPVEVGVEDINTPLVSTGVYSLYTDEWIVEPTQNANKEIPDVKKADFDEIVQLVEKAIESKDIAQMREVWDLIRKLRKSSLAADGEFGEGNLLFKKLRNGGFLKRLKDAINDAVSKDLSLEMFYTSRFYPKTPIPTVSEIRPMTCP